MENRQDEQLLTMQALIDANNKDIDEKTKQKYFQVTKIKQEFTNIKIITESVFLTRKYGLTNGPGY